MLAVRTLKSYFRAWLHHGRRLLPWSTVREDIIYALLIRETDVHQKYDKLWNFKLFGGAIC